MSAHTLREVLESWARRHSPNFVTRSFVAGLVGALAVSGTALGATPLGSQFQVNTYTNNGQNRPSVSVDAVGNFVVVWQSRANAGSDTSLYSIQGRRFDASGNAIGGEFQVNTYTRNDQRYPSVSVDADGDFVVVWASLGSAGGDTSGYSIRRILNFSTKYIPLRLIRLYFWKQLLNTA